MLAVFVGLLWRVTILGSMQAEHKLTSALTDTHTDGCVDYHERKTREKVFGSAESEQYTASHLGHGRSSLRRRLVSSPLNWF